MRTRVSRAFLAAEAASWLGDSRTAIVDVKGKVEIQLSLRYSFEKKQQRIIF